MALGNGSSQKKKKMSLNMLLVCKHVVTSSMPVNKGVNRYFWIYYNTHTHSMKVFFSSKMQILRSVLSVARRTAVLSLAIK